MNMEEKLNQDIDELSKIKISIIEIKRSYQTMDGKLELKNEIKKMIDILDKIYIELFENSQKLHLFRMYGDFYLPAISKLIIRYNSLKNKNIKSADVQELFTKIEDTINKLNIHFQKKYNSLFEDELLDLDVEIKVLLRELGNK